MDRNERMTMRDLLKNAHTNRKKTSLSAQWRQGVMAEVRSTPFDREEYGFARLAPRFAMGGAALSAAGLVAGAWELSQLAQEIQAAYASEAVDLLSSMWTLI